MSWRLSQWQDTEVTVAITLASLAADPNLLTGRQSDAFDLTGYDDIQVSGKITTGTSPTVDRRIEIWLVGSRDGTNWPDVFGAADAARTISSSAIKNGICKAVYGFTVSATSSAPYEFNNITIGRTTGILLPKKGVFFVTQSSAVALHATAGNHWIVIRPGNPQLVKW